MKAIAEKKIIRFYNAELEEIIKKRDKELKAKAVEKARENAKKNLPEADKTGQFAILTSDIKASYEELAMEVFQYNQPETLLPELYMDNEKAKEQEKICLEDIKKLEHQNLSDERNLNNEKPVDLMSKYRKGYLLLLIIGAGELFFNTMAFQAIGDNLLFSLLIALSVTVAMLMLAHYSAILIKKETRTKQKIFIGVSSLLIVTGVCLVMAYLRSEYMAKNGISINMLLFLILNIGLFAVAALVSYTQMPSWEEIKENQRIKKICQAIEKRTNQINNLKQNIKNVKDALIETNKIRTKISYDTKYKIAVIQKKYLEAVSLYKCENIDFRSDSKIPISFSEEVPELELSTPATNNYEILDVEEI